MTALSFRDRRSIAGEIRRAEGVPGGSAPPPSHRFPVLAVMIAALLFLLTPDPSLCPKCRGVLLEMPRAFVCQPCGTVWQRGEEPCGNCGGYRDADGRGILCGMCCRFYRLYGELPARVS